jgi:hypothetical protein
MKKPDELLPKILACFEKKPSAIILGGSYSTNEQCVIVRDNQTIMLSDFDLLCIYDNAIDNEVKINVYKKMLDLALSLDQKNPYFHIGLKIRAKDELLSEIQTLYFKELSENAQTLSGDGFLSHFELGTKFGFDCFSGKEILYKELYNSALMRMWCNILFFPIRITADKKSTKYYNLWYSYFLSRGFMDWIMLELIENNNWGSSYTTRFNLWRDNYATNDVLPLFQLCYNVKIGNGEVDYKNIIFPVINFSINKLYYYAEKASKSQDNYELKFIVAMLHVLYKAGESNIIDESELNKARQYLDCFSNSRISGFCTGWELWHKLRSVYSDYKFSLNEQYKIDHIVYTDHFLKLGGQYV